MSSPTPSETDASHPSPGIREVPYNYTSFSDREIVIRFLGPKSWQTLNALRDSRKTGQSARMLLEILGDLWIISRNPYLEETLLDHPRRLDTLLAMMRERIDRIVTRSQGNQSVEEVIQSTRGAVQAFADGFPKTRTLRKKILKALLPITAADNIDFTGRARVAHVTDATDWRIAYPFVVLTPDREEESAALVAACIKLGMTLIPRGGGTGYTGSGVPIHPDTAILNMERLNHIGAVEITPLPGVADPVPVIRVEAGAVTARVAEAAEQAGYVFAVDPTSKNGCTIGGNVAMNAGGKKAVLWGTTLDNLVSWRMVTPDGQWLEVTRLGHNLGKIHDQPEAHFQVIRFEADGITVRGKPEQLTLTAAEIRKPGLGKDVTNKYLGGLPGIQKEGCDGLITSARFLLHRRPTLTHTVCLEFFGSDLGRAVPAIVEIKHYLDDHPTVGCAGLEHMDERYVKAVGYNTKASRNERPKMVLLADVVGENQAEVEQATATVVQLAKARGGDGFIAVSREGRDRFWADRSRTAAIAAHTNAFKINEDIVIPLEKLAEYTEGIERINIEQSIKNKLTIVRELTQFIAGKPFARHLATAGYPSSQEGEAIIAAKQTAALIRLEQVQRRWRSILSHLEAPWTDPAILLSDDERQQGKEGESLLRLLLRHGLRLSYRYEVERPIKKLFAGELWQGILQQLDAIHGQHRANRLFVALHMHAGDGNVHTNIPVNSNDYTMLQEAERMVHQIMTLTLALGGSVSGEHGIGLTKYAYLDPQAIDAFVRYKQKVDPNGHFNRGKLMPGSGLDNAYTPSLRLVQQETIILQESDFGALNDDFSHCLRCGKCQSVCTTHVPAANLLYSPRNKILATGLVIEAFLYEEQTKRGVSLHHFDEMGDLSDHCTVCHRCVVPCPVNIDFGKVTIRMREILTRNHQKKSSLGAKLALAYLSTSDARWIRWAQTGPIRAGYAAQRMGHQWADRFGLINHQKRPERTGGMPSAKAQILPLLRRPLPDHIHGQTVRLALDLENPKIIPLLRHPTAYQPKNDTVFYFPGCGSERLFSEISMAVLALLYHQGVQTVLPPGYLCCGFPQGAAGDEPTSRHLSTSNRVLFHRLANTLRYLDIKTVLVSCGTCLTQLERYQFDAIFPGCRLMDIHEYLAEKGVRTQAASGQPFLFHDPCHTPTKRQPVLTMASSLMGGEATLSDRCCGEAGTFAVARPDIAAQVQYGKSLVLQQSGLGQRTPQNPEDPAPCPVVTSCPSCYQGLARFRQELAIEPTFLAVALVKNALGETWREQFIEEVRQEGIERVLF